MFPAIYFYFLLAVVGYHPISRQNMLLAMAYATRFERKKKKLKCCSLHDCMQIMDRLRNYKWVQHVPVEKNNVLSDSIKAPAYLFPLVPLLVLKILAH